MQGTKIIDLKDVYLEGTQNQLLRDPDCRIGRELCWCVDVSKKWLLHCSSKGQLNSEWIHEVIISPKMLRILPWKFIRGSGRNLKNFRLAFWEKRWPHKFILNLTDIHQLPVFHQIPYHLFWSSYLANHSSVSSLEVSIAIFPILYMAMPNQKGIDWT